LMAATTIKVVMVGLRRWILYRVEANLRPQIGLKLKGAYPIDVLC
jgi:hypothetical protein